MYAYIKSKNNPVSLRLSPNAEEAVEWLKSFRNDTPPAPIADADTMREVRRYRLAIKHSATVDALNACACMKENVMGEYISYADYCILLAALDKAQKENGALKELNMVHGRINLEQVGQIKRLEKVRVAAAMSRLRDCDYHYQGIRECELDEALKEAAKIE